ncbi:hypothetical protein BcellWH2_04591 [Bacteroides cellulosilyticus]|uniref:DUF3575 domain-containing protein n=2 Tax=Bacteroides cellulosilyticus TaxID=246787 RepID=A0A0P0G4X0_9BACE|nr:hypothetical protein BcellWH2_04591 [Bacteroides cellulosilyticus]
MSCKRNPGSHLKRNTFILFLLLLLFRLADLHSQTLAVKSDLLTGALSSPNLSVEVKLSDRFTLEAGFHYNPFPAGGDKRWKHWFVQPELRYWMCQPFGGHFFGAHLMYGVYNAGDMKLPLGLFKGVRSSRYEGDFLGLGVSYGYHFILSPRWSIETSLGVGFLHIGYERYRCLHCGEQTGGGYKNFIAPTRAAVSLVYLIN